MEEIKVNEEFAGIRVDQFLALALQDYSRSTIQSWIDQKKIIVNDEIVKRNYRVKTDDVIRYEILTEDIELVAVPMDLDIVYEDDAIIVVNKPKGLIVHPSASSLNQATLVHGLLAHTKQLSDINGEFRPGIVHRIDKDTSGLLVVAKTNEAHEILVQDLKDRKISREYLALVHHPFEHQSATVDAPIGRDPKNRQRMCVTDQNSKHAVTHLYLVENFREYGILRCKLDTGRTHQIRVHCQYIKHPIVGDQTYSYKNTPDTNGQSLHAYKLSLEHPITREKLTFECELPQEMKDVIEEIRRLD